MEDLELTGEHEISDLLGREEFQKIQDMFAQALDLGFIAVDFRGHPIIKYSGFTEFCNKLRKDEKCRDMCYKCDAHGGLHGAITGKPYIYKCHAGLVDFAVPLILHGKYMGAIMGGQVQLIDPPDDLVPILPQSTKWDDKPELIEAASKLHRVSYQRLLASVNMIQELVQSMLEEGYRKVSEKELERKELELQQEKAARITLEAAMEGRMFSFLNEYISEDYIFSMLNIVSRLAYREKAEQTERAVCEFADMMRYISENKNTSFVTLGEEIDYIRSFLQLQSWRLDGSVSFTVEAPQTLRGMPCPFMLLQPIVETSLIRAAQSGMIHGELSVLVEADAQSLTICISDNGRGISDAEIARLLEGKSLPGDMNEWKQISNINNRLRKLFGLEYGLSVQSIEGGIKGTSVRIHLPVKNSEMLER